MKILRMEQGSPEWELARTGIPTASRFDQIITPAKLELSKSAEKFMRRCVAEWILGYPIDWDGNSGYMERGKEREHRAREWYELQNDVEVEQVGLILRDDELVGCSPDGLIGNDGTFEAKVPAIDTHLGYLDNPQSLYADYRIQVQGGLMLTDRNFCDMVSYHDMLPKVRLRVARDPAVILPLSTAIDAFVIGMLEMRERWAPYKQEAPLRIASVA